MGRSWILIVAVGLAALGAWLAFALLGGDVPGASPTADSVVEVGEDAPRASAELTGKVEERGARSGPSGEPTPDAVDDVRTAEEPAPAASERRALETLPEPFVLEGSVHDAESGAPLAGMVVAVGNPRSLLGEVGGGPLALTDERGRYSIEVADLSETHVCVVPPEGWNGAELRKPLPALRAGGRGTVDFALVRWPPPVAGDVRGVLESERGAWTAESLPRPDTVVLDLVSTTLPRLTRRAEVVVVEDGAGGFGVTFELVDVPRGNYQLTLSSLDEYRWAPEQLVVAPPAPGLRFLRYDLERTLPLRFDVVDAETGERVDGWEVRHIKTSWTQESGVLLHTGPFEGDLPLDARFDWSLAADGYAPAFGDETSFAVEDGVRVAEVRLARGWGVRLFVLGGKGTKRPIAGASVWLDGEEVGSSGADGTLDVLRERRPQRVEVRYLDWRLVHDPLEPWQGRSPERRGQVMPVVLEPAD